MTCMLTNKKKLAACAAAGVAAFGAQGVADADFTGSYAHANWTFSAGGTDGAASGQTATTLTLTGGNNSIGGVVGVLGTTQYTIAAAAAGTVSFNFSMTSPDSGNFDYHGWVLNGVYTTVGNNSNSPQAGPISFGVNAGDIFGMFVHTQDGLFGAMTVDYSNFSGPEAAIPEPSAIALLALGTVGGLGFRRRRS
jgi:PEP-CTERM motif